MPTIAENYVADPDIFIEEEEEGDGTPTPQKPNILDRTNNLVYSIQNKLQTNKVQYALFGAANAFKAAYTGDLAKIARDINKGPKNAPRSVGEAYKIASNITYDEIISGITQPIGRLGGKKAESLVTSLARRTNRGVCYDASCIVEKALRKYNPSDTTMKLIGKLSGIVDKDGNETTDTHAIVISGTPAKGYTFYDPINKFEHSGAYLGKSKDEVKCILKKEGFHYPGDIKFKAFPNE